MQRSATQCSLNNKTFPNRLSTWIGGFFMFFFNTLGINFYT